MRSMTHWSMLVANMRGGSSWINHPAFGVVDAHESRPIILTLARKLIESGMPRRPSTFFIFALHESFGTGKPHRHVLTEAAFFAAVAGHLQLDIKVQVTGKNFATMFRGDQHFSILRGCYVSPWHSPFCRRTSSIG
jgi:hypothetical protein